MQAIRPQPKQEAFLRSSADVAIFGGAAGGGKSWALLLDPLRHRHRAGFAGVLFRRTYPQVTNPGGMADASLRLYPHAGGAWRGGDLLWRFPSGATIRFGHLQHEDSVLDWQGSEVPFIGFDELTHFSRRQFLYMLSRNRTTAGLRPYVRATCNPDADSWVKEFVAPWVDPAHPDYPFPAGALRWFTIENDALRWVAAGWRDEQGVAGKSFTFIPASVYDNPILLQANPEYLANLRALPYVEQMRLLHGDWSVRAEAGKVFNRDWFPVVSPFDVLADGVDCRFFDFAASTRQLAGDDPDFTATALLRRQGSRYIVLHAHQERVPPAQHLDYMRQWIEEDLRRIAGTSVRLMIRWEEEPGSAGMRETWRLVSEFDGLDVAGVKPVGDKLTRARALAAQAYGGNVAIVEAPWNLLFLAHMHQVPDAPHDDLMDATVAAYNVLSLHDPRADAALAQAFRLWG